MPVQDTPSVWRLAFSSLDKPLAAREVMAALGVEAIPAIGLAKREEEVFLPERSAPVLLPRDSQALYLLQRIRDEAHRFAITYHRQVRAKQSAQSLLDEVPGIGPKRRKALLRRLGSVEGMRGATVDELAAVEGMTRKAAETLAAHLGGEDAPQGAVSDFPTTVIDYESTLLTKSLIVVYCESAG